MITGYDTVFLAAAPVDSAIRDLLDEVAARWPEMLVLTAEGDEDGDFRPWSEARPSVPSDEGRVLVAKDTAMVSFWDENGYELTAEGDGPFTILYQPMERTSLPVSALEDPYSRSGGAGFDPYEVRLLGSSFSLVTVVTPDDTDEPFSRSVIEGLAAVLAVR